MSTKSNQKMVKRSRFVNYGCGFKAPGGWLNFDASPTLRLQRIPVLGGILIPQHRRFPNEVIWGDVTKGLPLETASCKAVFASHVLEHLSRDDYVKALKESYRILEMGGRFRLIVPDLRCLVLNYLAMLEEGKADANDSFMIESCLGVESRPRGLKGLAVAVLGNSAHRWMWDKESLGETLLKAGFREHRIAQFGDSDEPAFHDVEEESRFVNAIAFEAKK